MIQKSENHLIPVCGVVSIRLTLGDHLHLRAQWLFHTTLLVLCQSVH